MPEEKEEPTNAFQSIIGAVVFFGLMFLVLKMTGCVGSEDVASTDSGTSNGAKIKEVLEQTSDYSIVSTTGLSSGVDVQNCNEVADFPPQAVRGFYAASRVLFPSVLGETTDIYCKFTSTIMMGVPIVSVKYYPNETEMMRPEDTAVGDFVDGFVSASVGVDDVGEMAIEFNGWKGGNDLGTYCQRSDNTLTSGNCVTQQ